MKEIIPLKKDILFKTKVSEITNINLDLDYKVLEDTISGKVNMIGTYKMTEASVIEEDFMYSIPFSIAISKRIKKDSINIEIEDFDYAIEKDILKSSINLNLTCEEEIEAKEEISNYEEIIVPEEDNYEEIINNEIIENNYENNENINNITNNIVNMEDNYYTYKVHIVREGDTIENISKKYDIDLENIKLYNDTKTINIGDKIIIPQINND